MKANKVHVIKNKKLFHVVLGCLLIIAIITTITSGILRRSKSKTINHYYQSYSYILEGFSQAINYYLINYRSSMMEMIIQNKIQKLESSEEIIEYLSEQFEHSHPDFYNLYYMNKDAVLIFSDGHIDDYSDSITLSEVIAKSDPFCVSELVISRAEDIPLFNIMNPVRNEYGEVTGVLGASVKVETIQQVLQSIKLGDIGTMYLQDDKGKFMVHKDKNYIGKTYTPPSTKYENFTSQYISSQPDGHIITEEPNGEEVDLFYTHVPHSNWTLSIGTPHSSIQEIYNDYARATTILISLFVFCILLLIVQGILTVHYVVSQKLKTVDIDPLTNLLTRARFEIEAQRLARKNPKNKFILIECDIRGLKFINQNYGGQEADKLIIYFSQHLNKMVKQVGGGLIGRGYADHFYIFIKVTSIHKAIAEFKNYNTKLNEEIKNYDISFFPKFGISFLMPISDGPRPEIQELIGQASFAKSTIKDNMLVQYALYNSHLLEVVNRERFIENNMESALENGEFFVLYQPKIELLTERVVGAEALVRWNSPKLGLLRPDEFIPLFERNGFIRKLDFYVYKKVFTFINKMISTNQKIVPISMNMSRSHSKPEKFMHNFLKIFNEFNIPPKMVEIEILERSFMNGNTLKDFTDLLHQEGFSVAMDDFGSGESSLNMLTQIPVDVLKFDRTFLVSSTSEDGTIDSTSANFIETLIMLSKDLKKQTIFEGVETKEQIEFLRTIECDQVQGYYFSKPLTEIDFIQYLNDNPVKDYD